MFNLAWDETGEKTYETGVDRGVLYPVAANGTYPLGVVWNGLTAVTESPSGAEPNPIYADNRKYLTMMSLEEFGASVEAYTYPKEFEVCDGSAEISPGIVIGQQSRKGFGLAYRTIIGNDTELENHGYKIHLIYGCMASPSEKNYQTIGETPEAINFSWELTTTPVPVPGFKPTASLTIDSRTLSPAQMLEIEEILYGSGPSTARLPLPSEIIAIMNAAPGPIAMESISPEDDATDVDAASNIVMTFNNPIKMEAVVVSKSTGEVVPGTKTFDSSKKILTFDPTATLEPSTSYLITVAGVTDAFDQVLAPSVVNFLTEA